MKTAHTAGPWYRNIKPATKYTTVWSGRNKHVAYVATSGLAEDEVEANICLISAAPEMLEILKAIMTPPEPYAAGQEYRDLVQSVRERALSIIAKATGLG